MHTLGWAFLFLGAFLFCVIMGILAAPKRPK